MTTSAYLDKNLEPTEEMLASALLEAYELWQELFQHISDLYPEIKKEWKIYNKNYDWSLKVLFKKRNLFFFTPLVSAFRIRIVLGEKALAVVNACYLPQETKTAFGEARTYAEGRSIDIAVNSKQQLEALKTLLQIKYDNLYAKEP